MTPKSYIIIGIEVHLSLNKLNSKLFCSCSLPEPDSNPNTHTCETCLAMPGSKPVTNKKAVEHSVKLALALNSKIQPEIIFSRKQYLYPDLPSGYQRTQYEIPLGVGGHVQLSSGKKINLRRVHLEEDPGALIHPSGLQKSSHVLVDYNRAGIPLCEVVTEPDMSSPEEAREFMNKLIEIVQYLEISDSSKSAVKADINVSIKESNYTRVEIKNVTGFKEIEKALNYEIQRQKQETGEGKKIIQETRGWDTLKGATFPLRTKETEEDYGYITESDLTPIELKQSWVNEVKKDIPELAQSKVQKFVSEHKINKIDAEVIAKEKILAELFEKVAAEINPVLAARWLRRELMRVLHYNKKELHEIELDETHLIDLLRLVETKQITDNVAKKLLEKLIEKPFDVKEYIQKQNLGKLSDSDEIEKICLETIKENAQAVEDYQQGEKKALNFIIGQIMRKTKGTASTAVVAEVIERRIKDKKKS